MRDTTQDDKADTVHRLGLTTRQTHLDDQLIIAEAADSVEGVSRRHFRLQIQTDIQRSNSEDGGGPRTHCLP